MSVFGVILVRIFPHSDWMCISPYSVRMRENTDQNNSKHEHFSRSDKSIINAYRSHVTWPHFWSNVTNYTAQKMKFSVKDFFSKCDQIRMKRRIWLNLLKKFLIENFFFCAAPHAEFDTKNLLSKNVRDIFRTLTKILTERSWKSRSGPSDACYGLRHRCWQVPK